MTTPSESSLENEKLAQLYVDTSKKILDAMNAKDSELAALRQENERLKNLTHFGYSEVPELKSKVEDLSRQAAGLAKILEIIKSFVPGDIAHGKVTPFTESQLLYQIYIRAKNGLTAYRDGQKEEKES